MGVIKPHLDVKLVMPVLINELDLLEPVRSILQKRWGEIDYQCEPFPFSHTDYYAEEMGSVQYRYFYSFRELITVDSLPAIKLETNSLEESFSREERRCINLDPGYMSPGKFVLATTKNQQHRLYIRDGIYEEITLFYREGRWQAHPWTYPDYASVPYLDILTQIRKIYMIQAEPFLKQNRSALGQSIKK